MIDTEIEVMFFDTDCGGVVSNIAYLRFFEIARTRLTDALGLSLSEMVKTQVFPAVSRTEVDYRKPARLGDKLRIRARIERFEKVRMHCHFEMTRFEGDAAVMAECRQVVVLVQMPEGKPRRIPDAWLRIFPEAENGPVIAESKREPRG
jgi:YbgC/YbaW family acyl-CoA thioester hydrolase